MHADGQYRTFREIYDESGGHRLVLGFVRDRDAELAWNFDRLIWETRVGSDWVQRVVFSRDEVAKTGARRRWVADIAEFDPQRGRAIVALGEEGEPNWERHAWARYAWWACDLLKKNFVELLEGYMPPGESEFRFCPCCRSHLAAVAAGGQQRGFCPRCAFNIERLAGVERGGFGLPDIMDLAEMIDLVPESICRENGVMPLAEVEDDVLAMAVSDISDKAMLDKLKFILNRHVLPIHVQRDWIARQIDRYYGSV